MTVSEKLNVLCDESLFRLFAETVRIRVARGNLSDTAALDALGNTLCQTASAIETERARA